MRRILAALLLIPLLPVALAADGVEIEADAAARELAVTAQSGQAVQATVGYTLDLAGPTPLRLLTAVRDASGNGIHHNATWRIDGNIVGTTSRTTTLLVGALPPGRHPVVVVWSLPGQASGALDLQAFARREVAGDSGSAAGVGGGVAISGLHVTRTGLPAGGGAPATVGGATPALLGLSYDRRPDGTFLAWGTSIPATTALIVSGPGGLVQRSLPANVRFTADLGNLPDGLYDFNLTAREEGGRVGFLAGRVRLQGLGVGTPLGPALAQGLAGHLGNPVDPYGVFLVDQDRDGRPDRLLDAAGLVLLVRAFEQQGRLLVQAGGAGHLLLEVNTGSVRAVQPLAGTTGEDTATGAFRHVLVTTPAGTGWVLVAVRDPRPEDELVGVQRADGTPLPTEAVWEEAGTLRFADDAPGPYSLVYRLPPESGVPWGTAALLLGGGVLGGVMATLLLRRRIQ